jgi:hypothetical protein
VKPFFLAVLKKHSITTDLPLDFVSTPLGSSPLLSGSDVSILVRAEPIITSAKRPNVTVTQLANPIFDAIKAKAPNPASQNKFEIPDYVNH